MATPGLVEALLPVTHVLSPCFYLLNLINLIANKNSILYFFFFILFFFQSPYIGQKVPFFSIQKNYGLM